MLAQHHRFQYVIVHKKNDGTFARNFNGGYITYSIKYHIKNIILCSTNLMLPDFYRKEQYSPEIQVWLRYSLKEASENPHRSEIGGADGTRVAYC